MRLSRREFLGGAGAGCLASCAPRAPEIDVRGRIEAHRPSRLKELPGDLRSRVGSAHFNGRYCLTQKPFLLEGAEKLIELGIRLAKFWFDPSRAANSYPHNSRWGEYRSLVELAQSEYFRQAFDLPFATVILIAHAPGETAWREKPQPDDFYEGVQRSHFEFADYLLAEYGKRERTFILQNWEGDWQLRGAGETWSPPPADWRERCERMKLWLAARQRGVARARARRPDARARVVHAAEVNRVVDGWNGIPTMTRHVLPGVEADLVSYSCWDSLKDPARLWRCIEDIRAHARPSPLFGTNQVYVGEIGIPENLAPDRIAERWDELFGVLLALDVPFVAQWQLYCNEFRDRKDPPAVPVKDPAALRGFWLVRPDGSLSETGRFFRRLLA